MPLRSTILRIQPKMAGADLLSTKRVHLGQDEPVTIVEICQIALPLVIGAQQHGESGVVASSTHCLHDLMDSQMPFYEIVQFCQGQAKA